MFVSACQVSAVIVVSSFMICNCFVKQAGCIPLFVLHREQVLNIVKEDRFEIVPLHSPQWYPSAPSPFRGGVLSSEGGASFDDPMLNTDVPMIVVTAVTRRRNARLNDKSSPSRRNLVTVQAE